jgi:MFS family permease
MTAVGTPERTVDRPGAFAPLRHLPFRFLVAGRTITMLGNAVAPIALAFAVLDLTGSARDLGLVVGARSLANVLFVLFGGVIADRLPRHLVMVGASLLAATTQATVAATVLTGTATIPLLLAMSAVNGAVAALSMPATAAMLPQTVPGGVRQQANALNRLSINGAMIVGASLGGVLVAAVGPGWGLAVDATTFALAAALFGPLRMAPPAAAPAAAVGDVAEAAASGEAGASPSRASIFSDLRVGWTEFRTRTWLWVVVAGFCVSNAALTGGVGVLGPLVADETLGRKAWGLILAAETAGMVIGGLVAIRLRLRHLLFYGVAWCLAEVLLLGTLGIAPVVVLLILAALATGFGIEQFSVAWETSMQEHVPAEKLARVYSYDMLGSFLAIPLGQIVAGPLAEAYGPRPVLVGAAVLCGLVALAMLASRDVRRLPHEVGLSESTT